MKRARAWLTPLLGLLWSVAVAGQDASEAAGFGVDGWLGLSAKYNSNLELADADDPDRGKKSSAIAEPNAQVRLTGTWDPRWWVDVEYAGRANFHRRHTEEDWYFNRAHVALSRFVGDHAVNLSSEFRHLTESGDNRYDFWRHTGLASYRHVFSERWQLRVGFQNIATRYPQTRSLDYTVNGYFAEVRTVWGPRLTTYYLFDRQFYRGTADPQESDPEASPDEGRRRTFKLGADWVMSGRRVLSGTYTYQVDRSEAPPGLQQVGDFEGHEDTQDIDAEFDLDKHKATLLYSQRWSRYTFSAYGEWIYKDFDQRIVIDTLVDDETDREEEILIPGQGRQDRLFLTSAFVKMRFNERLRLKLRYLFRMRRSSAPLEDYTDHIVFLGPEYTF